MIPHVSSARAGPMILRNPDLLGGGEKSRGNSSVPSDGVNTSDV